LLSADQVEPKPEWDIQIATVGLTPLAPTEALTPDAFVTLLDFAYLAVHNGDLDSRDNIGLRAIYDWTRDEVAFPALQRRILSGHDTDLLKRMGYDPQVPLDTKLRDRKGELVKIGLDARVAAWRRRSGGINRSPRSLDRARTSSGPAPLLEGRARSTFLVRLDHAEAVALRVRNDDVVRIGRPLVPVHLGGPKPQQPLHLSGLIVCV
jgi:hypothetical protein